MSDITPVFVDYETFWDVGFGLKSTKLNMTDYVNDPRFAIHGAACAVGFNEPQWLRGLALQEFIHAQPKDALFVGHHTLFDGYITWKHYYRVFGDYFCTMGLIEALMQGAVGRGLDEAMTTLLGWKSGKTDILKRTKGKYWQDFTADEKVEMATYACNDLKGTQELFAHYAHKLPHSEWQIMSTILKMACDPVLELDEILLNQALRDAQQDRDERIEAACLYFGITEDDLKGNITFEALLAKCDYPMPMKPSPSKGPDKMIPALAKTDQGFQDMLEAEDPRVKALAEGRLAVKSTQGITRAQRFININKQIGRLPVFYNYYRAHTGRLSGANKYNLANLKRGSDLRKSVRAPEGYVLAVADSSQIECRDNGYLAGQEDLIQLFREGRDPYNDMASTIFGRTIDRKNNPDDFMEGFIGKTAVLGLGYQMGGPKFKYTCEMGAKTQLGIDYEIDIDEAYRIVNIYREKNYKIAQAWELAQEWLYRMVQGGDNFTHDYGDAYLEFRPKENKIFFPNGTYLYFPLLDVQDGNFTYVNKLGSKYVNKYIYGGKLIENIVQKHSRDIVAAQMLRISDRYRVVLHTYDENVALVPEREADEGTAWVIEQMKWRPSWAAGIPLDAEGGWAKEYSK